MFGKKGKKTFRGPKLIGWNSLVNGEGQRFKFKYLAPAELHQYYDRLIEENAQALLKEAAEKGRDLEVTGRLREEAERLYKEKNNF